MLISRQYKRRPHHPHTITVSDQTQPEPRSRVVWKLRNCPSTPPPPPTAEARRGEKLGGKKKGKKKKGGGDFCEATEPDMTPHLPVSPSSSHHLLDAAPTPASPAHAQHRRRRRRRMCGGGRGRGGGAHQVRCCAAAAPQPRVATGAGLRGAAATTRVFVVSDLHTDYRENMDWVLRLPVGGGGGGGDGVGIDALVVAGDVAETRDNFARTMAALRERFGAVFYVPGNHDLWLRRENGRYVSWISPHPLFRFLSFPPLSCPSRLSLQARCLTKCLGLVIDMYYSYLLKLHE